MLYREVEEKIRSHSASLEENMKENLYSKTNIYDSINIKPKIYQAVIKNPSGVNYTNKPFGIYISFKKGECINDKKIVVKNSSGAILPSQWEGDRDVRTGVLLDNWEDGSLKNGTIWTIGNLSVNEQKIFNIEISKEDNIQTDNIPQTIVEVGVQESYLANGIVYLTHKNASWGILSATKNGVNLAEGYSLQASSIKNSSYADINTSQTGNTTIISKEVLGNGSIFKDIISKFSYVYNPNIICTFKTRIWSNGDVDYETRTETLAEISSGVLNGVMDKIQWKPITGATLDAHNHELYTAEISTNSYILTGFRWHQRHGESYDTNNYPIVGNNGVGKCYIGWQNTSPNVLTIPKGAYWTSSTYISLNFDNVSNERLRRINRLYTRATNENIRTLKRRFSSLVKFYVENMRDWNLENGENLFPGIYALESLGLMNLSGENLYNKAKEQYNNSLVYYANGTKVGFVNAWKTTDWRRGIQYIGRDMSVLPYIYKESLKRNDVVFGNSILTVIHNLADAFVEIETLSGGNGKVALRGDGSMATSSDCANAEATAIKHIKLSLDFEENTNRRSCMDRIISRLNSTVQYNTRLPYSKVEIDTYYDFLINPRLHYHAFALFDFLKSSPTLNFNIEQLSFEVTNATGQIKEIGYEYQQERRGLGSNYTYFACVLNFANTISALEQACKLLEYMISFMYPNGGHLFPIDGWSNSDNPIASTPIESQALLEMVL
ncbi:hypothetical protein [Clostridium sp.]|uniref:hypothetical protein n=1 Tax=Clostridium sp. TaxID=1506 RepID=UPI001D71D95B|nr:hypothetical protein [Clostridium sp.]MBS5307802.1 hypothetical protein [Clostridium sp.]